MNILGGDKTYIDYFQGVSASRLGLSNCFGIRVWDGFYCAVVKLGDGQANSCGKEFHIPIQLAKAPSHIRMIVDDHLLNYPASDLMDVLTGKKTFQQALDSAKGDVQRAIANRSCLVLNES